MVVRRDSGILYYSVFPIGNDFATSKLVENINSGTLVLYFCHLPEPQVLNMDISPKYDRRQSACVFHWGNFRSSKQHEIHHCVSWDAHDTSICQQQKRTGKKTDTQSTSLPFCSYTLLRQIEVMRTCFNSLIRLTQNSFITLTQRSQNIWNTCFHFILSFIIIDTSSIIK